MGWASGFNAGTRMARTWIDTYNQAKDEQEFNRIQNEKPEVSEGFTADQGDQLRAAADSGLYDIGFKNGRYTVTPKSEPGNEGFIAPQQVTDMFGERRAGVMTPRQVDTARQRQMAGAVSRRNPLAGARMMRELDQGEREEQSHGLNMRRGELGLQRETRANQVEDDALGFQTAVGNFIKEGVANPEVVDRDRLGINATHPRYTITSAADPKTGKSTGQYNFITVDDEGRDRTIPLNFMQMAEARALIKAMEQYPGQSTTALQRLSAINKDIAEAVARDNNMRLESAKVNIDARYKGQLGNAAESNARTQAGRLAADRQQARMGQPVQWVDSQGNVKISVPVMGRDGSMTWQTSDAPQGFRMPRQMPSVKDQHDMAQSLVNTQNPDFPEQKFTYATALDYVRRMAGGEGGGVELNLPRRGAPAGQQTDPGPAPQARPSLTQRFGSALVAQPGETGDFGIQRLLDEVGVGSGYQGPQTGFRNVGR